MKFNIVLYNPKHSVHVHAFTMIADALSNCLADLNHNAPYIEVNNSSEIHQRATEVDWQIILGTNVDPTVILPKNTIIYNAEQWCSNWFGQELQDLYRKHIVWDYSAENTAMLRQLYGDEFIQETVEFSYHPSQLHTLRFAKEYDFIHVGSLNDRRWNIIKELRRIGYKVEIVNSAYGYERDVAIQKASVLLNIHYYEDGVFEATRVIPQIVNDVRVVSEVCETTPLLPQAKYNDLVELAIQQLYATNDQTALINYFKSKEMIDEVVKGLSSLPEAPKVEQSGLCLLLLTTDEPKVIERAINSALPYISSWVCSFNGQYEETPNLIRKLLGHLPGELFVDPWQSYGANRNKLIEKAEELAFAPYGLILDADEVIEHWVDVPHTLDGYRVEEWMGTFFNPKTRIISLSKQWRYVGSVHEYIHCENATLGHIPIKLRNKRDGRGSEIPPEERYADEAKSLLQQLEKDPNDYRACFYLAQSYELAGQLDNAIKYYRQRATMGGFEEERWLATYRIASIFLRTPEYHDRAAGAILESFNQRPTRAEPIFDLASWYRSVGMYTVAKILLTHIVSMEVPQDLLSITISKYGASWRVLEELALCNYYLRDFQNCKEQYEKAMSLAPESELTRLKTSYGYVLRQI